MSLLPQARKGWHSTQAVRLENGGGSVRVLCENCKLEMKLREKKQHSDMTTHSFYICSEKGGCSASVKVIRQGTRKQGDGDDEAGNL